MEKGYSVYQNTATTCDRHLAKYLRFVMGNSDSKKMSVSKIKENNAEFCYCGKLAAFHLVADRGGRSGKA